jgi:hypothetical protein
VARELGSTALTGGLGPVTASLPPLSVGRSRQVKGQGYRGGVHPAVWECLDRAYQSPYRIESNYAREYRFAVAFSASVGWITVVNPDGETYSREWKITAEGLYALRHHYYQEGNN